MKKSGNVNHLEPDRPELLEAYPDRKKKFEAVGWFQTCTRLHVCNYEVARAFANGFDGHTVQIGYLKMQVTEKSNAAATTLPIEGERWFKNKIITGADINKFLKLEHRDPNWKKGIPRSCLEKEWDDLLKMIQLFITCEVAKLDEETPARETRATRKRALLQEEGTSKIVQQPIISEVKEVYTRKRKRTVGKTKGLSTENVSVLTNPSLVINPNVSVAEEEHQVVKSSKITKDKKAQTSFKQPHTRPTNKLRLNSKALLDPSLKSSNVINLNETLETSSMKSEKKKDIKGKRKMKQGTPTFGGSKSKGKRCNEKAVESERGIDKSKLLADVISGNISV